MFEKEGKLLANTSKAQTTLFVILAIILVGSVAVYFLFTQIISVDYPKDFKKIEDHFLNCIEDELNIAIDEISERGGYLYLPEFEPGSQYAPSSSQLDFLGKGIPYWVYVSGNNVIREQVPTKKDMEEQIELYLEDSIKNCDFFMFSEQGYDVKLDNIKAEVNINQRNIEADIDADLDIKKADNSARISTHKISINSKLGQFYDTALSIYKEQRESAFLENYTLDILHLNAPVDGLEFSCAPLVWNMFNVSEKFTTALENNFITLRTKGSHTHTPEKRKYFEVPLKTDDSVRFFYSKDWPTKIEPLGESDFLIANPVGNQPGLAALGFCYVNYHFVYDVLHPVLIQIYDEREIFQFPVIVFIDNNNAREAYKGEDTIDSDAAEICKNKNTNIEIATYNTELNPIEADISYKCFNEVCYIGKTEIKKSISSIEESFPQCVNGFVIAKADGYRTAKYQLSTNQEAAAEIFLSKTYTLDLSIITNSKQTSDQAVITFLGQDVETTTSQSVLWPSQKEITLSEGYYNITVQIFKDSAITIPALTTHTCSEIPRPGILGFFGATKESCYDLEIPAQKIDNVITGGGETTWYISESELQQSKTLEIIATQFKTPSSLEELQANYESLETENIYLRFEDA